MTPNKLYTVELLFSQLKLAADVVSKAASDARRVGSDRREDDSEATTRYRDDALQKAERLEELHLAITGEVL